MWPLFALRETGLMPALEFSSSWKKVLGGSLCLSRVKDLFSANGEPVYSMHIDSVEERFLLAGRGDGSVQIYDTQQESKDGFGPFLKQHDPVGTSCGDDPQAHQYIVSAVHWYPADYGLFVTGSLDQNVNVWDAELIKVVSQFKIPGKVHSLSMAPNALVAVASEENVVRLCDIASGSSTHSLNGHTSGIYAVSWSADSEYLLFSGGMDGTIRLWDVRNSKCLLLLGSASKNRGISKAHAGAVTSLVPTLDGGSLVSSGLDSSVTVWNLRSMGEKLVECVGAASSPSAIGVKPMAVCSHSQRVYHPSKKCIQVFDMLSGKLVSTLKGHFDSVNCCVFNNAAQELYSSSTDCQILAWSPVTERVPGDETEIILPEGTMPNEDSWSDAD